MNRNARPRPELPDPPAAGDGVALAAVGIQITVDVKPESREEFLQAMEALRSKETLPGDRVSSGLFEDRRQRNRFLLIEHWQDPGQLEECLQSDRFRAVIGAVTVLGTVRHIFAHSATCLTHILRQENHNPAQRGPS